MINFSTKSYAKLFVLVLAACSVFVTWQARAGTSTPAYSGCGGVIAPAVNSEYEQQVLDLVNEERQNAGLPPLKLVQELTNSARYHATDMGQDNYFNHDTYDRVNSSLQFVCDTWQRILSFYPPNWSSLAENIAAGYGSPQDVMTGWMNSTGHRNNILSANSWEMGVGYYDLGGDYGRYWVQNFGRRRDYYPLLINRDAASTDNRQVSLYIYGTWTEVRLRNDSGELYPTQWSAWMPFSNTMPWTLEHGVGLHTVYAEMRTDTQSAASQDSIDLSSDLVPVLGNLPDALAFRYSRPGQVAIPAEYVLTPQNTGAGDGLTWQVAGSGAWFAITPLQGVTPAPFTVSLQGLDALSAGTYTGSITVTATDPAEGSPHAIALTLEVVDNVFQQVFLPFIRK